MKKIITFISCILVIAVFYTCEDYQDEDYTVAEIDQVACELLDAFEVDSNFIVLKPNAVIDTLLLTIADTIAALEEAGQVFYSNADSVWTFDVSTSTDTTLFIFDNTAGGSETIFYLDQYTDTDLGVSVYEKNGTPVTSVDHSIPLEVVANCTNIKTRIVYSLIADKYIVWFSCEVATVKKFNAVVL